ncbi:MAG: hypothetical protein AABX66_00765 [Nanoarchaeota archaeon]
MKQMFVLLLLLFSFISFSNAIELGVSPPEVNISVFQGVKTCFNISVFGNGILKVKDVWSENESNLIVDYNSSSSDMRIDVYHDKEIKINDKGVLDICLKPNNNGNYYGLLVISTGNAAVGVWIKINVKSSIGTGFSVLEIEHSEKWLLGVSLILIVLLIFLFLRLKTRRIIA